MSKAPIQYNDIESLFLKSVHNKQHKLAAKIGSKSIIRLKHKYVHNKG